MAVVDEPFRQRLAVCQKCVVRCNGQEEIKNTERYSPPADSYHDKPKQQDEKEDVLEDKPALE